MLGLLQAFSLVLDQYLARLGVNILIFGTHTWAAIVFSTVSENSKSGKTVWKSIEDGYLSSPSYPSEALMLAFGGSFAFLLGGTFFTAIVGTAAPFIVVGAPLSVLSNIWAFLSLNRHKKVSENQIGELVSLSKTLSSNSRLTDEERGILFDSKLSSVADWLSSNGIEEGSIIHIYMNNEWRKAKVQGLEVLTLDERPLKVRLDEVFLWL